MMTSEKTRGLLLAAILLAVASVLSAGSFRLGAEAGINYADISTVHRHGATETGGIYYDFAIPVEYEFTEHMSLASAIHWRADNSHYVMTYYTSESGSLVSAESGNYTRIRHFLEFPFTFRLTYGEDPVTIFVGAGAYVGVYLGMWQYGTGDGPTGNSTGSSATGPETGDNRFTAGLVAEGGVGLELGRGRLYLAGRYSYCLTSLVKAQRDTVNIYFQNVTINLGYSIPLGGAR